MQATQSTSSSTTTNQRNNSTSSVASSAANNNRNNEGLARSSVNGERNANTERKSKNRSTNNNNRNNNESSTTTNRNQNTFNYPTRILTFGFPFSGQPDIVRSLQKDEFYSNHVMFNNLKELCNWFFGQRFTIRFEREIQLVCNLIYYGTTTCTGQSTLGEEYCDLLQVQLKEKTKPQVNSNKFSPKTLYIVKSTSSTRLLFVLYELIVPYLFDRGTSHWLSHYFNPNGISENMRYYISMLKEFVQFILRFNLVSFYINGKFLQVSKRLAGIRYIYTGKTDGDSYKRPNFFLLSLLIMIQQVISAFLFIKSVVVQHVSKKKEEEKKCDNNESITLDGVSYIEDYIDGRTETEFKCCLCLERRVKTTATMCGHLYCWDCITECVSNSKEPKCPICRQSISFQSLSRLYCYDSQMVKQVEGE